MEVGQIIRVKFLGRDPTTGAMRLSRKLLLQSTVPRVTDMTRSDGKEFS